MQKPKRQSSEESSSRNAKDKKINTNKDQGKAVKKHVSPAKVAKPSTDSKLEALDQKWSEYFRTLEVMLLSKSFNQAELVLNQLSSLAKPSPAGAVDNTKPFLEPLPTDHHSPATNQPTGHASSAAYSPA